MGDQTYPKTTSDAAVYAERIDAIKVGFVPLRVTHE